MRYRRFDLPTRRAMAGVSLVELMIAITLGLMVLATLAGVFANASTSRTELDRMSRQIENGRFAIEIIAEDLRTAGFYGELAVNKATVPNQPTVVQLAPGPLPNPCSTNAADWQQAMLLHVQGYDNGVGIPPCVPSVELKAGTDVLVVRRLATCEAGVAGCPAGVANRPYMQVSKCPAETAALSTLYAGPAYGNGNAVFNLHQRDCVNLAAQRQYIVNIYFISINNGQGQPIPTLKRLEFDGTQFNEVPLVEGIEELNIEYGIDNNDDGAPDVYKADPSTYGYIYNLDGYGYRPCAGACTPNETWQRVVTARITLLARNTEASNNYTDNKTYELGLDKDGNPITVTPGDAYRRHVYTSTVRVVNVSQRKDVP